MLRREHRALAAARALRPTDADVEQRSLSSYDLALGVVDDLVDGPTAVSDAGLDATLPATGTTATAGAAW